MGKFKKIRYTTLSFRDFSRQLQANSHAVSVKSSVTLEIEGTTFFIEFDSDDEHYETSVMTEYEGIILLRVARHNEQKVIDQFLNKPRGSIIVG